MSTAEALDRLAAEWAAACRAKPVDVPARDRAFREAQRLLQDKAARDLDWFVRSFDDPERWFFAVNVIYGNLPRKLLRPILEAGIRHPDVSTNQWFVHAAIKSYGEDEVYAILAEHLQAAPDKWARDKVRAALYWVPRARARL